MKGVFIFKSNKEIKRWSEMFRKIIIAIMLLAYLFVPIK